MASFQGEMPPLWVIGAEGGAELVNYRVRGNHIIVDRLFAAAELRLGGEHQKKVRPGGHTDILTDQPRPLRDQQGAAGRTVVDGLGDLGGDLARQIGAQASDQGCRDHRAGLHGQSRALLVWNRIIMPNGRSIVLERQPGADPEGYAGLEDEVDNHWGALFKAALLSTILSVGSEAGTSNNQDGLLDAIRRGSSDSISQTGRQVVGRSLNVQPTITIRPGFSVRVIVTRDLVMEPYQG